MTRSELKIRAKALLRENYISKMLLFIVPIILNLVNVAFSLFDRKSGTSQPSRSELQQQIQNGGTGFIIRLFLGLMLALLISALIWVIIEAVITTMEMGGDYSYLKIARDELPEPKSSDAFVLFRQGHFGKVLALMLVQTLVYLVFVALSFVLIGIPFLIYFWLGWSQAGYVLFDKLDKGEYQGVWDVLSTSSRLMKGNRGRYFVYQLSFIGWYLLQAFTFHLADFWVIPYMQMSMVTFYEALIADDLE